MQVVEVKVGCCAKTPDGACGKRPAEFDLDRGGAYFCREHGADFTAADPALEARVRELLSGAGFAEFWVAHEEAEIGTQVVERPATTPGYLLHALGRRLMIYWAGADMSHPTHRAWLDRYRAALPASEFSIELARPRLAAVYPYLVVGWANDNR